MEERRRRSHGVRAAASHAKEDQMQEGIDEDVQTDVLIAANCAEGDVAAIAAAEDGVRGASTARSPLAWNVIRNTRDAIRFTGSCFSRAGTGDCASS